MRGRDCVKKQGTCATQTSLLACPRYSKCHCTGTTQPHLLLQKERPFLLITAGKIRLTGRGRGRGREEAERQKHGASILRDEALGCWCLLPGAPAAARPHAQVPPPALSPGPHWKTTREGSAVCIFREIGPDVQAEAAWPLSRSHSTSSVLFRPASFFLLSSCRDTTPTSPSFPGPID